MLSGYVAGRIVVAPKPSQVNVFASLDRPIIVIRPKPTEVPILRLVGLLRHIRRFWSLLAKMVDLNSGHVSLDRLGLMRAGPKTSEVGILCLLGPLGLGMLFWGIEALPPGIHLGNVSLVLITAIAERVLPLQTQSNVLRCGLGAPSRLGKRPVITAYPDLVYTEF